MIYEYISNFIYSLLPAEAITTYQVYINDISFWLTMLFVVIMVAVPLIIVYNIITTICYTIKPKAETRGRKKRDL